MSLERTFGLQWRLAVVCFAAGALSALITLTLYLAAVYYGFQQHVAAIMAFTSGALVGLVAAIFGSVITRSVKLRLWEAGRMAGRIARGDYRARVETGPADEVGWLEEQLNLMAVQLETAVGALKDLAEKNRLLSEEAGRGAALEERMRLARDLHDTVNQQLFVLAMRAAAMNKHLQDVNCDHLTLVADSEVMENMSRQAHSQIRELILQLRPVTLEREGFAIALREYITKLAEREGWKITDRIDLNILLIGKQGEGLFRIAQEALNNISKHASADTVEIRLMQQKSQIELVIADNGKGFKLHDPVSSAAVGLSGIRERSAEIGGGVEIDSSPGRGTRITVRLSLPEERSD
jgi:two-component system, NarL family, sensor histidine kinase LiaS